MPTARSSGNDDRRLTKEFSVRFILTMFLLSVLSIGAAVRHTSPPLPSTSTVRLELMDRYDYVSSTSTSSTVTLTTTTTTTLPVGDWSCPQWLGVALELGWPASELSTLDRVLYRESRCRTDAFNKDDPHGGSYGLLQINGFWCIKWLQQQDVLSKCKELFDPAVNLTAGLTIYRRSHWHPWGIR